MFMHAVDVEEQAQDKVSDVSVVNTRRELDRNSKFQDKISAAAQDVHNSMEILRQRQSQIEASKAQAVGRMDFQDAEAVQKESMRLKELYSQNVGCMQKTADEQDNLKAVRITLLSQEATHGKQRSEGLAEVEATIRKAIADLTQRADELAAKIRHGADASGAVSQQAEEARQELGNARAIARIESKTFELLQELHLVSASSRRDCDAALRRHVILQSQLKKAQHLAAASRENRDDLNDSLETATQLEVFQTALELQVATRDMQAVNSASNHSGLEIKKVASLQRPRLSM
ncbi:MAG: hypothetical protein WDW38_005435 [Sanguina aurantia]